MATTTTKATKAATTTPAVMTESQVSTTAAALLLRYRSISALKAAAAKLRAQYGPANWGKILATAKAARRGAIDTAAAAAKAETFNYTAVLGAVFARLSRSKDWAALCKFAGAKYTGKDTAARAAAVVRDYYPNVDTTGAPVSVVRYLYGSMVLETWAVRDLSDTAAVSVLKSALKGMATAAKRAATAGADTAKATGAKVHEAGVISAVYAAGTKTDTNGAALVVPAFRIDIDTKAGGKAQPGAAALIGRPVPANAAKLTDINADTRAAHTAAANKALAAVTGPKATAAAKHTAKTPAPKAAPKAPKATATAPAVNSAAAAKAAAAVAA